MVHIADFVEIDDPIRLYVPQTVAGPPMTFDCKVKYVLKSTVLLQFPIEQADLAQSVVTAGMELESEFLKRGTNMRCGCPPRSRPSSGEKHGQCPG
ncbi:MAG: hypothetical protein R2857_15290 [Vampirovibrionales bacterium]